MLLFGMMIASFVQSLPHCFGYFLANASLHCLIPVHNDYTMIQSLAQTIIVLSRFHLWIFRELYTRICCGWK